MSLVNSADSAEAGLAVAKLRKINQGLRVGLRDATAGWREAVVLCRGVEKKCEELYGEVEELKRQRSVQRSKEADLLDRIQGMEKVGEVRVGGGVGGSSRRSEAAIFVHRTRHLLRLSSSLHEPHNH
jgi:hypothetical protein